MMWPGVEEPRPRDRFDPAEIGDQPDLVQHFFRHAIAPGTRLSTCAALEMAGGFRTSPAGKWRPMQGREVLSRRGYMWQASIGRLLCIRGYDRYSEGEAQMQWKLWGVLPVLNVSGQDLARSARGRLAAELAAWVPAALLPRFGTRWEVAGPETARVHMEIHGEPISVDLTVGTKGELQRLELLRWGEYGTNSGGYEWIRFGGPANDCRTFDGYTIPTRIRPGWNPGEDARFEFFDAKLQTVQFR